jgi:thiol-disulfide isomerase/thioredoxin
MFALRSVKTLRKLASQNLKYSYLIYSSNSISHIPKFGFAKDSNKIGDMKDQDMGERARQRAEAIQQGPFDMREKAKEMARDIAKEETNEMRNQKKNLSDIKERLSGMKEQPRTTFTNQAAKPEDIELQAKNIIGGAAYDMRDKDRDTSGRVSETAAQSSFSSTDAGADFNATIRENMSKMADEVDYDSDMPMKMGIDIRETKQLETFLNKTDKPIVVDCYKAEEGHNRRLAPRLMSEMRDSIEDWLLVGANADVVKDLEKNFQVKEYPTLLLFHKGKLVETSRKGVGITKFMDTLEDLSHK